MPSTCSRAAGPRLTLIACRTASCRSSCAPRPTPDGNVAAVLLSSRRRHDRRARRASSASGELLECDSVIRGACKQQGLRHASSRCVGNLGNAAHYLLALAEDRSAVLAPGNRPFGTRVGPPKSPVPLRSGAPTPLEAESRLPFSASSVPPRVRRNRLARAKKKARASRPFEVGGTGLEPVTPSLSSWCSPN